MDLPYIDIQGILGTFPVVGAFHGFRLRGVIFHHSLRVGLIGAVRRVPKGIRMLDSPHLSHAVQHLAFFL